MSKRRVGGSGWAGVYGSFIGLSKSAAKGAGTRIRVAKKAKTKPEPLLSAELELALRPSDDRVLQAAKRVRAVQADIDNATARLVTLKGQLTTLSAGLKEEIRRANGIQSVAAPSLRRKKK